jgi:hypothetical protein
VLPHIASELDALAELCDLETLAAVNGWQIDSWTLDDEALGALAMVYEALLRGSVDAELTDALAEQGIDVTALLVDNSSARETITRADLVELVAAAAAIGADAWPATTLCMPNVPKGSRGRSEVGIDIMSVQMDFEDDTDTLGPAEKLFIGSVKHTISDPADLRRKLMASVSTDLTMPYIARQLRVFDGRLAERGFDARRLYLFLLDFPDEYHVEIAMIGGIDSSMIDEFRDQLRHLDQAGGSNRRCRHLVIEDIARLHELVDSA